MNNGHTVVASSAAPAGTAEGASGMEAGGEVWVFEQVNMVPALVVVGVLVWCGLSVVVVEVVVFDEVYDLNKYIYICIVPLSHPSRTHAPKGRIRPSGATTHGSPLCPQERQRPHRSRRRRHVL